MPIAPTSYGALLRSVGSFFLLYRGTGLSLQPVLMFSILNGLLDGISFVAFRQGLQSIDAGRAKPIIAVNLVIPVTLGIVILGESLNLCKVPSIYFSILAVYLFGSEDSQK